MSAIFQSLRGKAYVPLASGKSDYPQDFPVEFFPGNLLGIYTFFKDFLINILKILKSTVALGLTLNRSATHIRDSVLI